MKKNSLSLVAALLLCLPAIALGQTRGLFHETDCGSISNPNVDQVFCLQETTVAGRTAGHTYVWKGPITGWADVTGGASAGGDVVGPASATDGVPVLFDGTTGKLVKNSKVVLTQPATAATLTIINNKTFTVNKTITLDGTDGTTMTFPSTNATIARTDAANTFTGVQTMTSPVLITPTIGVAGGTSLLLSAASVAANYTAAAGGWLGWVGRAFMYSSGDGIIRLLNDAETDFDRLQLGGVTALFPSIKRATTRAQCRLADDSAACAFEGKFNSSDGTAGATTTCTIVGLTSITVKDGLITSCS